MTWTCESSEFSVSWHMTLISFACFLYNKKERAYARQRQAAEIPHTDFYISLSAASRKYQTVCHALRCGAQCRSNNWAKKKHTQAKKKKKSEDKQWEGGTSIKAVLFLLSNEPDPLSSPDHHRTLGLFSSFKMTQIFTPCPPPTPFPLPRPVPKGSSAHGGQVSCRPLKKPGADVRGPKTMLSSSKQTRTCTHSDGRGRTAHATRLIWAADRATGPVDESAILGRRWGLAVGAEHRKTDLNLD